ncbi:hypothetical protein GCM10025778_15100 [Paeniglutamicibacter antarcticus]|uniref:Uncharacterized protein n=1 Tax=Paeniglutamicibacter antarcticus TaxID=494023 RepID=A0ABP9TMM9_9MICC
MNSAARCFVMMNEENFSLDEPAGVDTSVIAEWSRHRSNPNGPISQHEEKRYRSEVCTEGDEVQDRPA